jgi:type I site-specific restriction-modification system R (restriction) subunit
MTRRYHNRAVDSVQVIEELISLAKEISAEAARGTEPGLNNEELAFYDSCCARVARNFWGSPRSQGKPRNTKARIATRLPP